MNDLKFAIRQLLKNPAFSAVAVLTLALGIGANLALFTMLDDQFLRPRPVFRPDELWSIVPADASGEPRFFNFSRPYYDAIRRYNRVFKDLISINGLTEKLRTSDGWEEIFGHMVTANYFDFVGVHPIVGRGFVPEDDKPGSALVTVVSYRFWKEQLEGNPALAGKTLNLGGNVFEIVGVAPPGFIGMGSRQPDLLVTYCAEELFFVSLPLNVFGRLQDGISPAAAADSLAPITQETTRTLHPVKYSPLRTPPDASNNSDFAGVALLRAGYGSADRHFAYEHRRSLIQVNSLAGFGTLLVLLIGAANLANLLLARGLDRRRELAIRLALGATRRALLRQLALEGGLLATLGTVAALLVLHWFGRMAPALMSAVVFNGAPVSLHTDARVLAFGVGIAWLVGVGFSLPPALLATRFDPFVALKDSGVTAGGRERRWSMRNTLVVAQIAGSLVLLSGVFLCLRAIREQLRADVGFRPEPLVVVKVDLESYTTNTAPQMVEELRRHFSLLPGVEAVGMMDGPPLSGERGSLLTDRLAGHEGSEVEFKRVHVGPECFRAIGIPLLAGREVTAGDTAAGRQVALVNESFVRKFWPQEQVLGTEIEEFRGQKYEVIGIVRDARLEITTKASVPTVYYSFSPWHGLRPTFIVRARKHPGVLIPPIRSELVNIHPRLRESVILRLSEAMRGPFSPQRNVMNLLGEIAAAALGLTVLGAYGLLSYRVKQRTREIGIRLAVGAQRTDVAKLLLGFGLWLVLAGICLGLPAAFGGSFLLRHLVSGVSPFDWLSFAIAAGAVMLATVLACLLPARRAAEVDPMEALRYE